MHGLKGDEQFDFLLHSELLQIAVGSHDLQLRFANEVSISVTSRLVVETGSDTDLSFSDFAMGASAIASFLGEQIVSYEIGADLLTLALKFSSGRSIKLIDDSSSLESYVITYGDRVFVI